MHCIFFFYLSALSSSWGPEGRDWLLPSSASRPLRVEGESGRQGQRPCREVEDSFQADAAGQRLSERCSVTNSWSLFPPPDSPETIGRRVAVGVGFCLAALLLAFWGVKLQKR